MIHLALMIALAGTPAETCATMQHRAARLATPVSQDGDEGATTIVATLAKWYDGPLAYAFTRYDGSPATCGAQTVTVTRKGFVFERSSDVAFEAIDKIFGNATTQDFVHAKYVAATLLADQPRSTPMRWYRGRLGGYASLTGSPSLTIYALDAFDRALAQARNAARFVH